MTMRKLYLGSVSSLSFEEEDISNNNGSSSGHSGLGYQSAQHGKSDSQFHFLQHEHEVELHGHELLELLTERIEEQVDFLIRAFFSEDKLCSTLGLRPTLRHVTRDILRMSEEEPYGVRGATIFLKMKNVKGEDKYLGSIAVDASTVSTFNLTMILEEERTMGVAIKNWFGQLFNNGKQALVISPQYQLKKEKLYRSDSGITLSHFHM